MGGPAPAPNCLVLFGHVPTPPVLGAGCNCACGCTGPQPFKMPRGESLSILLQVTDAQDVDFDLTGCTILFVVQLRKVGPQLLSYTSAGGPSPPPAIVIQPQTSPTTGQALINFAPGDTAMLIAGSYFYDMWIILADNVTTYRIIPTSPFTIEGPVNQST